MRILNGRFLGDSVGNFTYFDPQGGCSVIDYMIASEDLLSYVTYFNVMPLNEDSGDCIIRAGIKFEIPSTVIEDTTDLLTWPDSFKWDENSKTTHTTTLTNGSFDK